MSISVAEITKRLNEIAAMRRLTELDTVRMLDELVIMKFLLGYCHPDLLCRTVDDVVRLMKSGEPPMAAPTDWLPLLDFHGGGDFGIHLELGGKTVLQRPTDDMKDEHANDVLIVDASQTIDALIRTHFVAAFGQSLNNLEFVVLPSLLLDSSGYSALDDATQQQGG